MSREEPVSLGVIVKGPEGIVLAADSRVTLVGQVTGPTGPMQIPVTFDNAEKILRFGEPHQWVAAVTYGAAVIGLRSAHSFLPELEVELLKSHPKRATVSEYAAFISKFFEDQWKKFMPPVYIGPPMTFLIGGYDKGEPYGSVYLVEIPTQPTPAMRKPPDSGSGLDWGGQMEIANRLVKGFDPALPQAVISALGLSGESVTKLEAVLNQFELRIPYPVLPLQDCLDLASFLIETTITGQGLSLGIRGVGGVIEVAVITRTEPFRFVQQKVLHASKGETHEWH